MSNRVTLKDVAAQAGVSLTTVSLFLNGNASVCSAETAERIRTAVSDLNYVVRPRAATLAAREHGGGGHSGRGDASGSAVALLDASSGSWHSSDRFGAAAAGRSGGAAAGARVRTRSRNVGIVFSPDHDLLSPAEPAGSSSFSAERVWKGASQEAELEDYGLLSFSSRIRTGADVEPFLDGASAGVILASGGQDDRAERLAAAGLPVVLLGRFLDIPEDCGAVYAYERDTVDLALDHLMLLGHVGIAHYAGPAAEGETTGTAGRSAGDGVAPAPSDVATARLDRYRRHMRAVGIDEPDLIARSDSWQGSVTEAGQILDRWLALPAPPTAVFCASDSLARAMIAAAAERGMFVPDDLSVVGVGGVSGPEDLTTVVMPNEEIGRQAVRLLLRIVDGVQAASCRLAVPVTQLKVGSTSEKPSVVWQNVRRVPASSL